MWGGVSAGDAIAAFIGSMEAAGVRPVEPIGQQLGRDLIRFQCEGDRKGKRNGWAILHLDGTPAGAFGNYRLGVREKWRADRAESLSPEERRRLQREWREAAQRRESDKLERWRAAQTAARARWDGAGPVDPGHPYIIRKAMTGEGLRQRGNRLLVPMHDLDGRLWGLQEIAPDGFKQFQKGARIEGLMCIIGDGGNRLCIGEGTATMKAVRAATGYPVAIAFTGENLEPVARLIRKRWPRLDLIVCGDDDPHLLDNPNIRKNLGVEYATAAALAVCGRLSIPPRKVG